MCVHVSAQQSLGMHKAIDSYIGPPLDNRIGDLSFCSILKASIQLIIMTRLFYLLQDCLKDLRGRLVEMANIIQNRFEQETEDLQRKQAEHKSKQGSITKEDEEEYVVWCNEAIFRIHILEQRLNRYAVHT